MARPRKCRKVCAMPQNNRFAPIGQSACRETIVMRIEEYEAIRLIDLAGYTQEECAEQMGIARTTVQGIYIDARKKLADVLVNGKALWIEGGDYDLCQEDGTVCARKCRALCCKKKDFNAMGDEKNE